MTIAPAQLTIDVADVELQAQFWSSALGFKIDRSPDGNVHARATNVDGPGLPSIWFQPTGGPKPSKNRLHLDFDAEDPVAEVERLLALGARRCDVGQTGDEGFIVLADPEGNEFCVFTRPRSG